MITVVNGTPVTNDGQRRGQLGPCSTKGVTGLGVTQIVMGSLCVLFEIILIILYHSDLGFENKINGFVAPGVWNGIFILVVGIIGFAAAAKNTRGFIIAYMVLNIIAACAMPSFIALSSVGVDQSSDCRSTGSYYWFSTECDSYPHLALNILMLMMAISQFVMTIVAASLCCGPACCNSNGQVHAVMFHPGMQQQQQQQGGYATVMMGNQVYGQPVVYSQAQQNYGPQGYFVTAAQQPPAYYSVQPAPNHSQAAPIYSQAAPNFSQAAPNYNQAAPHYSQPPTFQAQSQQGPQEYAAAQKY